MLWTVLTGTLLGFKYKANNILSVVYITLFKYPTYFILHTNMISNFGKINQNNDISQ